MIKILDKSACCGCSSCAQRCPNESIEMIMDEEGFLYPKVNIDTCNNCGLCEDVCPTINKNLERHPLQCFAAKGKDTKLVDKSSSAGVFSLLAKRTIKNRGVIFGARFNSFWDVEHSYSETIVGIEDFQGSKYVQSRIGTCYKDAELFLKAGREVLFTGTPCQIAGLHKYLRKEYNNLICVDVICHGIPSPGVWRGYLKSIISPKRRNNTVSSSFYSPLSEREAYQIKGISFRDKRLGWKKYSFVLLSSRCTSRSEENSVSPSYKPLVCQKHYYNIFIRAFLHNFMLRYSCYNCPARKGRSGSDLLLGDYWGVAREYPSFIDSQGVSMVLAYSNKGIRILRELDLKTIEIKYKDTLGNINIEFNESKPLLRDSFFQEYSCKGVKVLYSYCKAIEPNSAIEFCKNAIFKFKSILSKK